MVRAALRARAPRSVRIDIHSLSVSEISGLSQIEGISPREVLVRLQAAGLKSLPGAGAEILVERVRKRIWRAKIVPEAWLGVMRDAQLLGMPTTATMMFGSIETAEERSSTSTCSARLQDETGGFTAFIPWFYVPYKTPLRGRRRGPRVSARARGLAPLPRQLAALQASWLTPGLKMGQLALFYGCDDMGGTIIESRSSTTPVPRTKRRARHLENDPSAPASTRSFATRTGTFAPECRSPPR